MISLKGRRVASEIHAAAEVTPCLGAPNPRAFALYKVIVLQYIAFPERR